VIVPVGFSLTRVGAHESYSDVAIREIVDTPDWLIDVDIALYDTQTKRAFGLQGRLVKRTDVEFGHEMGTLFESKAGVMPSFASREYLLELRTEIDRLLRNKDAGNQTGEPS
jgi:hypothetical protein